MGDGIYAGVGFANQHFTEARMRGLLESDYGFGILHLETHFSLRPGNMARSSLLLGDGSHLSLDKWRSYDFGGIRLLTLSACQTGMAGSSTDDASEVEGRPTIVEQRGARAVLSGLWRVEDRSAARFMKTFYANLQRRETGIADALRGAQLPFIHAPAQDGGLAHPYYWAAFLLNTAGNFRIRPQPGG